MLPTLVFLLVVAIPMCSSSGPALHQIPQASVSRGRGTQLQSEVDLVLVPIAVTDRQDHIVRGLQKENFSVYDGGEQQVIRHFGNEDAPISLGVIFDTSNSMYGKIDKSREAVIRFLRSANPRDEFFLITFANRPELAVDFTNSVNDRLRPKAKPNGLTGLLNAVYLGIDLMKGARIDRKALLIVSDGGDNHSRYTARDVLAVASEAEVQIYAMGIFDEAPRTTAERNGPDLLKATTEVTGGRTFPVKNLKKISEAADELSR
jgi:Ca-activated chloride channel homolog